MIRAKAWADGEAIDAHYVVALMRRNYVENREQFHVKCTCCAKLRWRDRYEIRDHLSGKEVWRCTGCGEQQKPRLNFSDKAVIRTRPKMCKTCWNIGERRQAPECPECKLPPVAEQRTA